MSRLYFAVSILLLPFAQGQVRPPVKKPLPAKAAPAAPTTRYPIEAIRVTGSKLYDEAAIVSATGLRVGELFEERQVEAARDKLLANGAFTNISFRYAPAPGNKGYLVTFEVTDLTQLFEYRFDRLEADDDKLRAFLKQREPLFDRRVPGAAVVLTRLAGVVSDYLRSHNRPSQIEGRVVLDAGESLVMFAPPGQLPAVATVTFTGNKLISLTELQNKIHPVAVGSQYREARFRELLEIGIRPIYEARGRLRMTFPKVESKPSEGVKGLAVTVVIEEGESFSFGETRVNGIPGGAPAALIKAATLPEGEVADTQLITAAQSRLERLMRASSHMAATVEVRRTLNDAAHTCAVDFQIVPGPKYTFGKLSYQGLDLHGESEIRRLWTMKPGAAYDGEYPELFVNRIKEDQLFDGLENARAVATPNHQAFTVDVKLYFNEPKPKILQ